MSAKVGLFEIFDSYGFFNLHLVLPNAGKLQQIFVLGNESNLITMVLTFEKAGLQRNKKSLLSDFFPASSFYLLIDKG
jgi:hypothetical protein